MSGCSTAANKTRYLRRSRGFDRAKVVTENGEKYVYVACSQCQAICINGVPTHEKGCPNERYPEDDED